MNDQFAIPAGALRTVWVFRVDLPEEEAQAFAAPPAAGSGVSVSAAPLARALGLSRVDYSHVDLVRVSDISEFGMARYLTEAHGIDAASVEPDRDRLDSLTGLVLLVFAAALPNSATALSPKPPLSLVGRYTESLDFALRTAPVSAAAKGPVGDAPAKPVSEAAMSGRIASVALLVLFLLVGIMVWVAG